jgi:hypothetical protein
MIRILSCALAVAAAAALGFAQGQLRFNRKQNNPLASAHEISATINGRQLVLSYSAPSVRGRQIWGEGGLLSKEPNFPVWRAGSDNATSFHTDADLDMNGLMVPAGDYTLYVLPEPGRWQLIINRQTGQWGLEYRPDRDLGRVPMATGRAPQFIETLYMKLTPEGGNRGRLEIGWESVAASVGFTVRQ